MPDVGTSSRVLPNLNIASVIDGKYEVVEIIAEGGMSAVYQAYDRRLEREVALKFVLPDLGDGGRSRLLNEARLMATLRHPNVLPIYDIGEYEELPYLVLPYVSGDNLRGWAQAMGGPPVEPGRAVALLDEACQGVIALHDAGVIHYDIKPENILISATGHVAIADLGLGKFTRGEEDDPLLTGTAGYIAPENIIALPDLPTRYAAASDVYALGVTAYWLLSGEHPFQADSAPDTLQRQVTEELPAISSRHPEIHPAFDEPLRSATYLDPRKRCSARTFRRSLLAADEQRRAHLCKPSDARIVLVDDDPDMLILVTHIVEEALPSAEVLSFSDPVRAVEEIRAKPPTTVITDLNMPGMDGATLLRALREDEQTAKVPVVVLTGVGSAADWQELRRAGATKFLVKPLDHELLHDVVRRLHA